MKFRILWFFCACLFLANSGEISSQLINKTTAGNLELIYFGKRYSYLLPHVLKTHENAMSFHRKFWSYNDTTSSVVLNDFEDSGHAGALVMPFSQVQIGIEPYGFAFSIIPSNERFQWLFNHELTHIVMADKTNKQDDFFRKVFMGKIRRNEETPLSALWSYFTTPRWYSPRWYQEGIACFMETWMSGGMGRAMGTYDEMYFRSIINEDKKLYSLIGLETEGTSIDFQVGANSYLYGSRFVTYIAFKYGTEKMKDFFMRTDDSKAFYASQFEKVYGKSVNKAWNEWIEWEQKFQKDNINQLKEFPLTTFNPITNKPLGNVSSYGYNKQTGKLYAALNFPGQISQIAEIDVKTGLFKKIATLDSPVMYYTTDLAYNSKDEKIYITEQNNKHRNLVEVDIRNGKKRVLNQMSRTGSLTFNPADKSLWGVKHDNGYSMLVKIPEPYNQVIPIFTAPFGKSLFDLSISNKGDLLCASISGLKGEQSLIMFEMSELELGKTKYRTLHSLEDNTLTQFKFSGDDKFLIGTSYYNGVSNIWRISLEGNSFEMLSNTETGLFMPMQFNSDSLFALKFVRDGMIPGKLPIKVIEDANSINYLGNLVHQKNPEVEEWALPPASSLRQDSLKITDEEYFPLKLMRLANAYPDVSGFKQTVALGYRLNWRDPLGLSNLEIFLGTSPWSDYEDKQKIHAMMDWSYWNWKFSANYNGSHFYDLFGPTKRSRSGYSLSLGYGRKFSQKAPFEKFYDLSIHAYGDLEVLPGYQNVTSPIKSFQAFTATYGLSKLRKTLGGVIDEMGYSWEANSSLYFAGGDLYPSLESSQNIGFLIPHMRNTSFWIRNSIGQSFGNRMSSLSHFYFGGFRNNYVDWQAPEQYRKTTAFPGAEIDEIKAYNYVKTMGELNLKPIRLRDVGTTWLYPTYIKSSVFGTHLMNNFDRRSELSHIFGIGAQVDIQLVLLSYLKTTWSLGYAIKSEKDKPNTDQFMLSVKLLGN